MKTILGLSLLCASASLFAQVPAGEVTGSAWVHTAASARGAIAGAAVVLPARVAGGAQFAGAFRDLPASTTGKAPVVVFLHGSSGLGLKAIGEWQQWLASHGIASIAPDSFALPDRATYKSPIGKDLYEQMHALRASEIGLALAALRGTAWADGQQLVLAGTSEGAVAVARHPGDGFVGKMIFAWSCEDNYFVHAHQTSTAALPVLNIISTTDPFFSPSNTWLGNPAAKGHCAAALKPNGRASIALIPDAPHTLINHPAARHAALGFLKDVLPR